MIRSESGADLLNAPDLSVPFKMNDFEVYGVGGGFVVVNHYGDNLISAARVDIGILGDQWANIDDALLYLNRTAGHTSTKCAATGQKVGGAGILIYFKSKEQDTRENRQALLKALTKELRNFSKTNILLLPGNLPSEDLVHLYKENEKLTIAQTTETAKEELFLCSSIGSL